jgi:hypothetical protein
MVDAFATFQDLQARLNREFTVAEQSWITVLLEDASTYLREDVLGLQVYPQSTSTVEMFPDGGRVDIPNPPLISIGAVTRSGSPVEYVRRHNTVYVPIEYVPESVGLGGYVETPILVTFTYGYALAPESLKRWACVLVSQALLPLEQNLGLTVGGLSSVAVDDFKLAFADAGEMSGIALSDRNVALLREQFGVKQSYVVGTR